MGWFDLSVEGFWRSFFAAVLVAPGYALIVILSLGPTSAPWIAILLVQAIAYVIGWLMFPLAALAATRVLGLGARYVPLIVAANWAAVLQMVVFLAALLLQAILPDGLGSVVVAITTLAILFYQWFVIRTALESTGGIALALLLLDLLLNALVSGVADGLVV
jgi:Fe2+ transport system protein B